MYPDAVNLPVSWKNNMKTETHYFAVINPASKYSSQCNGIPFPVTFSPESDGYHWSGNYDRYRDADLILLFPTHENPTLEFEVNMYEIPDIEYQEFLKSAEWFKPVINRGYIKYRFSHINRSGQQISIR